MNGCGRVPIKLFSKTGGRPDRSQIRVGCLLHDALHAVPCRSPRMASWALLELQTPNQSQPLPPNATSCDEAWEAWALLHRVLPTCILSICLLNSHCRPRLSLEDIPLSLQDGAPSPHIGTGSPSTEAAPGTVSLQEVFAASGAPFCHPWDHCHAPSLLKASALSCFFPTKSEEFVLILPQKVAGDQ